MQITTWLFGILFDPKHRIDQVNCIGTVQCLDSQCGLTRCLPPGSGESDEENCRDDRHQAHPEKTAPDQEVST